MDTLQNIAVVIGAILVVGWLIKGISLWLTPKRKPRSRDELE